MSPEFKTQTEADYYIAVHGCCTVPFWSEPTVFIRGATVGAYNYGFMDRSDGDEWKRYTTQIRDAYIVVDEEIIRTDGHWFSIGSYVERTKEGNLTHTPIGDVPEPKAIESAKGDGSAFTFVTTDKHDFRGGDEITVYGSSESGFNGSFTVASVIDNNTFTVASTETPEDMEFSGVAELKDTRPNPPIDKVGGTYRNTQTHESDAPHPLVGVEMYDCSGLKKLGPSVVKWESTSSVSTTMKIYDVVGSGPTESNPDPACLRKRYLWLVNEVSRETKTHANIPAGVQGHVSWTNIQDITETCLDHPCWAEYCENRTYSEESPSTDNWGYDADIEAWGGPWQGTGTQQRVVTTKYRNGMGYKEFKRQSYAMMKSMLDSAELCGDGVRAVPMRAKYYVTPKPSHTSNSVSSNMNNIQLRFRVPNLLGGAPYKGTYEILYDVLEVPSDTSIEPWLVFENIELIWHGPGEGNYDDPSWLTDWITIDPPDEESGYREIVNVRYRAFKSSRLGVKYREHPYAFRKWDKPEPEPE